MTPFMKSVAVMCTLSLAIQALVWAVSAVYSPLLLVVTLVMFLTSLAFLAKR